MEVRGQRTWSTRLRGLVSEGGFWEPLTVLPGEMCTGIAWIVSTSPLTIVLTYLKMKYKLQSTYAFIMLGNTGNHSALHALDLADLSSLKPCNPTLCLAFFGL